MWNPFKSRRPLDPGAEEIARLNREADERALRPPTTHLQDYGIRYFAPGQPTFPYMEPESLDTIGDLAKALEILPNTFRPRP